MIGRGSMTGGAVGQPGMVEVNIAEIAGVLMTVDASARIMIGGRGMASHTIGAANNGMVEEGNAEICGIGVAKGTGTLVMIGRWRVATGAILPADDRMIEKDDVEICGIGMTQCASAGIMILRRGVTFDAVLRSDNTVVEAGILPVVDGMAGGTICPECALMGIVNGVAVGAVSRCAIVCFARVAA